MNKLQQRVQQRGQGGFTLVELLVVIAILAILAGVVVFAVGTSTDNARVTACNTERRAIVTAANATKAALLTDTAATTQAQRQAVLDGFVDGGAASGDFFQASFTAANTITFTRPTSNTLTTAQCANPTSMTLTI